MKKLVLTCVLYCGAAMASFALACEPAGEKPEFADPNTAETPQMVMANNAVREYVAAQAEFTNCARLIAAQHRREVRELEVFADEFIAISRDFCASNGSLLAACSR